ncbi:MAG: RNA polymerase sigma factor [Oscillospiraceae bacterium]|jgi:RNA polymerase sigma-70 factor (ECF subfamily)|nr:RNA polymerase sigma factor [Oscillospiraceae bacterium]
MNFPPYATVSIYEVDFKSEKIKGDMDAREFELLFVEHRRALERFVRWRISSRTDADDVLQDALLSAWSHRNSLRSMDAFKPWLLQIARNICNDYYRKRGRRDEIPLDGCEASLFAQSHERGLFVSDTLERMQSNSAEILRLAYFDALTQSETARLLGIPQGTVKSRQHNAKRQFCKEYEEEY